jgi:hypothetical protein
MVIKKHEIYYFDKSGRRYEGKDRTCPSCQKKEIVRKNNNSLQCQSCQRPTKPPEYYYFDSSGNKNRGRLRTCKICGEKKVVRESLTHDMCRPCKTRNRKSSLPVHILTIPSTGRLRRRKAVVRTCKKCGISRLARTDYIPRSDWCKKCAQKHPYAYKNGIGNYRKKVLEVFEKKCRLCSSDKYFSLHIHHIDQDRNNNSFDNLMILCKSCHVAVHWQIRKGKTPLKSLEIVKQKKILLPR